MKLKLVGVMLAAALGSAPAHATFFFGPSIHGYAASIAGKGTNWSGISPTFGGHPIVLAGPAKPVKPSRPTTPSKPAKPGWPSGGWSGSPGGSPPGGATDVPAPPIVMVFGLGVAGLWLGRRLRRAR